MGFADGFSCSLLPCLALALEVFLLSTILALAIFVPFDFPVFVTDFASSADKRL